MMKQKTVHPKNMQLRISDCCNAQTNSVQACFGDPEIVICPVCNHITTVTWKPMYFEVSRGTWRKIEYKPKENWKL